MALIFKNKQHDKNLNNKNSAPPLAARTNKDMIEPEICLEKASLFAKTLSRLYLDAPDLPLLEQLAVTDLAAIWPFAHNAASLEAFGKLSSCLRKQSPGCLEADLRDEHMRLFTGLGMPKAPIWGSVYLDEENLLMGESTTALENYLRASGLVAQLEHREPLDHIGYILSALAVFLERVNPENPDWGEIRILLGEHLLPWSGRFLELQNQYANTPFYQSIGVLADRFLTSLAAICDAGKSTRKLYY